MRAIGSLSVLTLIKESVKAQDELIEVPSNKCIDAIQGHFLPIFQN